MPKLSVYVPDELWELARRAKPEITAGSQLVQEGLQRLVAEMPAAVPEADAPFEAARARMIQQASEAYERGFRAAAATAAHLDWTDLVRLEMLKFNVERWARSYREAAERQMMAEAEPDKKDQILAPGEVGPKPEMLQSLIEAIGNWASPFDSESWEPDLAYGKGFAVALGQLYGSVVGQVGTLPTVPQNKREGGDVG